MSFLKYTPFLPSVEAQFWKIFSDKKLEVFKLSEAAIDILGSYSSGSYYATNYSHFNIDSNSFSLDTPAERGNFAVIGSLLNYNTLDEYKEADRNTVLEKECAKIYNVITSGDGLTNTSLLNTFILTSYADLKDYDYFFSFAFPILGGPKVQINSEIKALASEWNPEQAKTFTEAALQAKSIIHLFDTTTHQLIPFSSLPTLLSSLGSNQLGVAIFDSGIDANPGFIVRNFVFTISYYAQKQGLQSVPVQLILLRPLSPAVSNSAYQVYQSEQTQKQKETSFKYLTSQILDVIIPSLTPPSSSSSDTSSSLPYTAVGWVKEKDAIKSHHLSLKTTLDPRSMAESAVYLNLNLMRWRMVPSLDISKLKELKCLLLGAGTLGCYVARGLLAWGVPNITLVDRGKVAFSNPVRQPLFVYEDCLNGGRSKGEAAVDMLYRIFPIGGDPLEKGSDGENISTSPFRHYSLTIPMPGHPVQPAKEEEVKRDVVLLEQLIIEHDVVFMLTDSREARWLPTMLAAYYNKIAINSALGFDSLVVMRHGNLRGTNLPELQNIPRSSVATLPPSAAAAAVATTSDSSSSSSSSSSSYSSSSSSSSPSPSPSSFQEQNPHLGCYFCSDIVAPRNSFRTRTLDQQCTVTRPGLAPIAGGTAVELLMALLNHPLHALAPPYTGMRGGGGGGGEGKKEGRNDGSAAAAAAAVAEEEEEEEDNPMGFVPHQLRLGLQRFQQDLYRIDPYPMCIACCAKVRVEYEKSGFAFLLRVFNDPAYLEQLVGITSLLKGGEDVDPEILEIDGDEEKEDGFELV